MVREFTGLDHDDITKLSGWLIILEDRQTRDSASQFLQDASVPLVIVLFRQLRPGSHVVEDANNI